MASDQFIADARKAAEEMLAEKIVSWRQENDGMTFPTPDQYGRFFRDMGHPDAVRLMDNRFPRNHKILTPVC